MGAAGHETRWGVLWVIDDPLLRLELHASTVDLLRALLGALEQMSDGTAPALTPEQRSYLVQAMDIAGSTRPTGVSEPALS